MLQAKVGSITERSSQLAELDRDALSTDALQPNPVMSSEDFEKELTEWCNGAPEGAKSAYELESFKMRVCFHVMLSSPGSAGARVLDFSNQTELTTLPEVLGALPELTEIHLQGCKQLKTLPLSLKNLTALKTLNLMGCEALSNKAEVLSTLPSTVCVIEKESDLLSLPEGSSLILKKNSSNELSAQSVHGNNVYRDLTLKSVTSLTIKTPQELTEVINNGKYERIEALCLKGDFADSELQTICQAFPALISLDLSESGERRDLTPIAGLKNLTTMNMSGSRFL